MNFFNLPGSTANVSTFREYLIAEQYSDRSNFYKMFSLNTQEEIDFPFISESFHWTQMEVKKSGILFKTPLPQKKQFPNNYTYCFFVGSTGKFLTHHRTEGLFETIIVKENIIIGRVTEDNGTRYTYYFDISGNLLAYTKQPKDTSYMSLYDANEKIVSFPRLDPEDIFHIDLVKDLESDKVLGLHLIVAFSCGQVPFFYQF